MRKFLPRLLLLAVLAVALAACANETQRREAPRATGERVAMDEALASEMLESYTAHLNALLEELERVAPLEDTEGDASATEGLSEVQDLRAAIERHIAEIERRQSLPAASPGKAGTPPARRQGPSSEEVSRLRREAATATEARAQVQRVNTERAQLQRLLDDAQEELDGLRARTKELEALTEAYVIALPKGGLAAMRKQNHLRRRGITPLTYEPTSQILPLGATGRTIVSVDPTAKTIFLGSKVSGARVVSAHRHYDDLFSVKRSQGQMAVVIRNPTAFWRVARYLIVEIE